MYSAIEICEKLNISTWTLANWYRWERKLLNEGKIEESYLPEPYVITNKKGKPRRWTESMYEELLMYKSKIVIGRNGIYGKYSNPLHEQTRKFKKSEETVETE